MGAVEEQLASASHSRLGEWLGGHRWSSSCGFDDGSDVGVEFCGPFGAEAVCHLSEDDAGPQRLFGAVVGGRNGAVGEEDEQVTSAALDDVLELVACGMARRDAQQSVETGVKLVSIGP